MAAPQLTTETPDGIRRTVIIRLSLTDEDTRHLEDIFDEFRLGCQLATDIGWTWHLTEQKELRAAAVDRIKQYTDLKSQHAILATDRAAEALTSIEELEDTDQATSKPTFTAPTATYDPRTLTIFPDQETISLTTTGDSSRIRATLELPEDQTRHQWQYITGEEWKITQSTVCYRDGAYWLHLGYKQPVPEALSAAENDTVLGVDLNVTGPFAVTSTGEFIGSADELTHQREEYERRRGALQETGTRSAHLTLKLIGSRFAGRSLGWLYQRANTLISHAVECDADGLVFEDLRGIRERMADDANFQQWAFREFQRVVAYKARAAGLWVAWVPAAYTSTECSRCGHIADANRDGKQFACEACGRHVHADYDAGVMIAKKYLRLHASQTCSDGRAPCQLALKSGTVPADANAVASVAVLWGWSTDKPQSSTSERSFGRAK